MQNKSGVAAIIIGLVLLVFFVGFFLARSNRPEIEEGKVYKLGYTYKAELPIGGTSSGTVEARVFDFQDRNMPEKSIIVPLFYGNGVQMIKLDNFLPEGTVQLERVKFSGGNIDGVEYPAFEFLRWKYNPGITEPQSVVPKMKPRS